MKQRSIRKMAVVVLAGLCVFGALNSLAVEINQVVVRQRWPWSRLVDIDYTLSCDPTETMDINVTARNGTETLILPLSSLSGDLYNISDGTHRIVWDPMATAYTNNGSLTSFSVELTATVPPLYMIVDLTKDTGADGQIEYVYESDLREGKWGSWVENPITNNGTVIESVVWTGVTNDPVYVTDKLVLRRVSAGSYTMGGQGINPKEVTLTKDFYAGVFMVTEAQWNKVLGGWGSASTPKISISYNHIRGATNDVPCIDWPTTGSEVSPASFMGQLRSATQFAGFDLPTAAQWEYLCRAGTTTVFNDGSVSADYTIPGTDERNNGNTNDYLDVLGWYKFNGDALLQLVGLKAANAWGLYDMHGNAWEWCLDWMGTAAGNTDPSGPVSGVSRVWRGGNHNSQASFCRSANNGSGYLPDSRGSGLSVRLVLNLP